MKKNRLLVTGAQGFVGHRFCQQAESAGFAVTRGVRRAGQMDDGSSVAVGDIAGDTDWTRALSGVDVVVHLAARVHVMHETAADPFAAFRAVNVVGTVNLARQAAAAGVRRLVYVSSIKVNGESTKEGQSFRESDPPHPQDPYAVSKWEAEQALHGFAAETGLEIVIVRPPLVYGPGVKGNFEQMLKMLARGMPLPLASVHNQRSLIHIGNLVDALLLCATHADAAGKTYLLSDGEDISTPALLRQLGAAMGHPARLLPCPSALLRAVGRVSGRAARIERLLGSLQVDSGRIRRELHWTPPYTLQQGLYETAQEYRAAR